MSLQVWLPLNKEGEFQNQGLADITITNNRATYDANGKIGGCYKTNRNNITFPSLSCMEMKHGKSFSLFNWVKGTTTGWLYACTAFELRLCPNFIQVHNGESGINYVARYNGTFDTNVWYHLGFTWDGENNILKLYLNGIQVAEDKNKTITNFNINPIFYISYDGPRYLNDFRIYDHCLSPKEVHEIAKGLVLHYPMNDSSINNNLIVGSTVFNYASCSSDITVERLENNSILKITTSSSSNGNWVRWQPGNESATNINMSVIPIKTPITVSCDILIESGSGIPTLFINQSYRSFIGNSNLIGQWQRVYYIYNYDGQTVSYNYFTPHFGVNRKLGSWKIKNPKIEIGSNNNPIWTENNQNQDIYDCSGYCNNGTVTGSLQVVDDSPRYKKSTKIINSTISHPLCLSNNNQEWTCCAWIKPTSQSGTQYLNNFNLGNIIYTNGGYPLLYLNDGTNDYYNYGNLKPNANEWTHIAFVFKNSTGYRHIFINGEDATNTWGPNKTSTPNGLPYTITLFSGFNGQVSDYREYSTALSEDDIKELYNTSAIINNNNTLEAYEFSESNTYSINKSGVLEGAEFIEQDGEVQINNTEQVFATEFTEI